MWLSKPIPYFTAATAKANDALVPVEQPTIARKKPLSKSPLVSARVAAHPATVGREPILHLEIQSLCLIV